MDWLARRIALDFLPPDKRSKLGIHSAEEEARSLTRQQLGGSDHRMTNRRDFATFECPHVQARSPTR